MELLCSVSLKEIVVGKCLQPGRFADRQAPALRYVRVDEVMAIF